MMKFYYKVWVDMIITLKNNPKNDGFWKLPSFAMMYIAMWLDYMVLKFILENYILGVKFYDFQINYFSIEYLNKLVNLIFTFDFLLIILNYYLIFYKKRYLKLIDKYEYSNGRLAKWFFFGSLFLPLILIGIALLNFKITGS
ncbi:hypothetical protein GO491_01150 [Flavobacteriaceae bacterium Ap0902]|nr:hypothetical protein [Flavobacteriaceae bacterium Ap0902]